MKLDRQTAETIYLVLIFAGILVMVVLGTLLQGVLK